MELTFQVTSVDTAIGNGNATVELIRVDPEIVKEACNHIYSVYNNIYLIVKDEEMGEFTVGQLFVLKAVVQ
jgi:hypothetical protein